LPDIIKQHQKTFDEISERSTTLFKNLLRDKVIRKEIIECGILKEFFSINQLYRILNYDISYASYSHYFTLLKTLASDSRIRQHTDYEIPQFLLYFFSGSIKKYNEISNNINDPDNSNLKSKYYFIIYIYVYIYLYICEFLLYIYIYFFFYSLFVVVVIFFLYI